MKLGEAIDKLMEIYEHFGDVPVMIKVENKDKNIILFLSDIKPAQNSQGKKSVLIYGGL